MPNRALVTMDRHFLSSYVQLLIKICHRRNIHAMGGMAAQIPIKNDPAANETALDKVRQDKLREVKAGHDGTWVAHPGLVPVAKAVFDEYMKTPNQIRREAGGRPCHREGSAGSARPAKSREAGLRLNINVGLQYLESWLRGNGCVPIYNLMEDAATAEISRAQVWQWVRHHAKLSDGRTITEELVFRHDEGRTRETEGDARRKPVHERQVRPGGAALRADDDQPAIRRVPDPEGIPIRVSRSA